MIATPQELDAASLKLSAEIRKARMRRLRDYAIAGGGLLLGFVALMAAALFVLPYV